MTFWGKPYKLTTIGLKKTIFSPIDISNGFVLKLEC